MSVRRAVRCALRSLPGAAERYPKQINGAVAMCPQVAGEVPWFNAYLDVAYTERTLLDPSSHEPLVGITDPTSEAA